MSLISSRWADSQRRIALAKSIAEEKLAAKVYFARARAAERAGDLGTAKRWRHVAGEERVHAREYMEALKWKL